MVLRIVRIVALVICLIFVCGCALNQTGILRTASIDEDRFGVAFQIPIDGKNIITFGGIYFEIIKKLSDRSNLDVFLYPYCSSGIGTQCGYTYKISKNGNLDFAVNPFVSLNISIISGSYYMGLNTILSNNNEKDKQWYGGLRIVKGTLGGHVDSYKILKLGPFIGTKIKSEEKYDLFEMAYLKSLIYKNENYSETAFSYSHTYPR